MAVCFNKRTWVWQETDTPEELLPSIEWIIDPVYSDEALCLEVGPNNWYYDVDGHTIRPMTELEMDTDEDKVLLAQFIKLSELSILRTATFNGGFTDSNNIRWGSTPSDVANINAVCTLISLGVVTENQTWRDHDNVGHELTLPALIGVAAEMAVFGKMCYMNSWILKTQIESLSLVSEIDQFDITVGWPT
jgi:hypothetical protein